MVRYSVFFFNSDFISIIPGNANLVYTIIRKRQVLFALSNLATDTHTITKLNTKNSNISSISSKKSTDNNSTNKQTIFQTNSKSTTDGEPLLNREISPQSDNNLTAAITNAMITTLAETPCR
jgi:hypothetical protein